MKSDVSCKDIFPHCNKLLYFLLIFPLSPACAERLFSRMNLVKTWLGNLLKQTSPENLLYISAESPKGLDDIVFEHFVN